VASRRLCSARQPAATRWPPRPHLHTPATLRMGAGRCGCRGGYSINLLNRAASCVDQTSSQTRHEDNDQTSDRWQDRHRQMDGSTFNGWSLGRCLMDGPTHAPQKTYRQTLGTSTHTCTRSQNDLSHTHPQNEFLRPKAAKNALPSVASAPPSEWPVTNTRVGCWPPDRRDSTLPMWHSSLLGSRTDENCCKKPGGARRDTQAPSEQPSTTFA
jgi:hypothetical protein